MMPAVGCLKVGNRSEAGGFREGGEERRQL